MVSISILPLGKIDQHSPPCLDESTEVQDSVLGSLVRAGPHWNPGFTDTWFWSAFIILVLSSWYLGEEACMAVSSCQQSI